MSNDGGNLEHPIGNLCLETVEMPLEHAFAHGGRGTTGLLNGESSAPCRPMLRDWIGRRRGDRRWGRGGRRRSRATGRGVNNRLSKYVRPIGIMLVADRER